MAYFDQEQFDVRCEWGVGGVQHIAPSDVIVVVDVLSFTTSVDVALGRGAIVLPYHRKDDSAVAYARERSAELASPRNRFDGKYSLAPSSLINAPPGVATRFAFPERVQHRVHCNDERRGGLGRLHSQRVRCGGVGATIR